MGKNNDIFENFMKTTIERDKDAPSMLPDQSMRAKAAAERPSADAAAAAEEGGGEQPRDAQASAAESSKGRQKIQVCLVLDRELRQKVEMLKVKLYRPSFSSLVVEALTDLLKKYGEQ